MRSAAKSPPRFCASTVLRTLLTLLLLPLLAGQAPAPSSDTVSKPEAPPAASESVEEEEEAPPLAGESALDTEEPPVLWQEPTRISPREVEKFSIERVLSGKPFIFQMEARRDPFAGPRKPQGPPPEPDAGLGGPEVVRAIAEVLDVEEQRRLVERADSVLKQMKARIAAQDYNEAVRLHDRELVRIIKIKDRITVPTLKSKLLSIERDAASVEKLIAEAKLNLLHEQITGLHSLLSKSWQAGDYEAVIEHAAGIGELFSQGREVLLSAPDARKRRDIAAMKTKADLYSHKAEVRLEFADKDFTIAGIAWAPKKSFVIINDRDLGIGAVIDDVRIVEIAPGKVTMEFKGETFEKYVQ